MSETNDKDVLTPEALQSMGDKKTVSSPFQLWERSILPNGETGIGYAVTEPVSIKVSNVKHNYGEPVDDTIPVTATAKVTAGKSEGNVINATSDNVITATGGVQQFGKFVTAINSVSNPENFVSREELTALVAIYLEERKQAMRRAAQRVSE